MSYHNGSMTTQKENKYTYGGFVRLKTEEKLFSYENSSYTKEDVNFPYRPKSQFIITIFVSHLKGLDRRSWLAIAMSVSINS